MLIKIQPYTIYRCFKYTVYLLLVLNIWFFFKEEYLASAATFSSGLDASKIIEAYSATIDTFAWVVLLLLFELETAVIPDERLKGSLKWILFLLRSIGYGFIIYAAYGYVAKYQTLSVVETMVAPDFCALINQGYTFINDLDKYAPLDTINCLVLNGAEVQRITGTAILGTEQAVVDILRLAIVDVINSLTWLVLVVFLEIEVFLQIKQWLSRRLFWAMAASKIVIYGTLFGCAVYWGVKGDFLDFWDAFLWLVAFFFIELNIFEWNQEVEQGRTSDPGPVAAL